MHKTADPSAAPPLGFSTKLAFGIGQIGEGTQFAVFLIFLLFYYNQVLGVPGTLCGIALALSLVFDAVNDPIIGNLSDSWRSKSGRRHPFMYAAALPLGVCFYLLFHPMVSGDWPLFGWLLTMTVLCRGAMTLYHVPHSSLGAELSQDFHERTVLVAMRHFFGAVAFLLVTFLGFLVYFVGTDEYPNGQLDPAAYGPFSTWLSLAMALSVWYSAFGTRDRIPHLPQVHPDHHFTLRGVVTDTWLAMRNPSFRWVITGFAIIIIAFGVAGSVNLYLATFFWQLDAGGIFVVLVAGPIGSMFGYMASKWFFGMLDKKRAVMWGIAIWLGAHSVPAPLFLAGMLPPAGSVGVMVAVAICAFLGSVGIAQMIVGLGTMLADIADEHEVLTHQRHEGIFFGAFSFTNKSSAAIGSLVGGIVLDLIKWPTGSAIRTAADIPWEALVQLAVIAGPITGLAALPGIWCFNHYRLNRDSHKDILNTLAARKVAANEG